MAKRKKTNIPFLQRFLVSVVDGFVALGFFVLLVIIPVYGAAMDKPLPGEALTAAVVLIMGFIVFVQTVESRSNHIDAASWVAAFTKWSLLLLATIGLGVGVVSSGSIGIKLLFGAFVMIVTLLIFHKTILAHPEFVFSRKLMSPIAALDRFMQGVYSGKCG